MQIISLHPIFKDIKPNDPESLEVLLCTECKTKIKHEILIDLKNIDSTDPRISLYTNYQILRCINCEAVSYQTKIYDSECYFPVGYNEDGSYKYEYDIQYLIYPVRDKETVLSKDFEKILPSEIYATYEEVIIALNNKMPLLTALGLRTLLEQIVKHFGHSDDLGQILNTFENEGYISTKQRALLDDIRYLGNDAAHRADRKLRKDLILHLKVLENLIQQLFVYYKLEEESEKKVIQGVSLRPSPKHPIPVVRETTCKRKSKKIL